MFSAFWTVYSGSSTTLGVFTALLGRTPLTTDGLSSTATLDSFGDWFENMLYGASASSYLCIAGGSMIGDNCGCC